MAPAAWHPPLRSGDEQISFKEYVFRKNDIHYDYMLQAEFEPTTKLLKEYRKTDNYYAEKKITGIAAVSSSPLLAAMRRKDLEAMYMVDLIESAVLQLQVLDGKVLKSTIKAGLKIDDEDEQKLIEDLKADYELLRVIKTNLVVMCLEMVAEIAEKKDDYEQSYEQFGKCLQLLVHEGSTNHPKVAEHMRYYTPRLLDKCLAWLPKLLRRRTTTSSPMKSALNLLCMKVPQTTRRLRSTCDTTPQGWRRTVRTTSTLSPALIKKNLIEK